MPLFNELELGDWLRKPVTETRAAMAERVVWGWLKPRLGLSDRPSPVPDEVFAWAIELGGIVYENPAGLNARQMGQFQEQFSAERRDQILDEVARSTQGTATAQPAGSFPEALDYPDPAW